MTVLQIINTLGLPALLSSVVLLILNRVFSKKDKIEERTLQKEDRLTKLEKDFAILKKEVEFQGKLLSRERNGSNILSFSLQILLKDRIVRMYNSYTKDKGFLPLTARESLKNIYEQYHELGGNGVITDLVDKLFELPVDPPPNQQGPYGD